MQDTSLEELLEIALFHPDEDTENEARDEIRARARERQITAGSLYQLYIAIADGSLSGFTIPAFNLRTLPYDMARIIFRIMKAHAVGVCIFEIARSELAYTDQTYDEIAICVLTAALQEGYQGKVFLQADHVQVHRPFFIEHPEQEVEAMKRLIHEALRAGFYNIDIDASTLVELTRPTPTEQQRDNAKITEDLTNFIRMNQPEGIEVTIGGEIGHIGEQNSTVEDFDAFMELYTKQLIGNGLSKVSAQTGTSHGGIVQPDGTIKKASVDFSVLTAIGQQAKEKYHMAGVVQHGASTLPIELFQEFPRSHTTEIHLSTAFQNTIFDTIPPLLRQEMYAYLDAVCEKERKPEWSDEQFYYKVRKKALGRFKQDLFALSDADKEPIIKRLTEQITTICEALGTFQTRDPMATFIK